MSYKFNVNPRTAIAGVAGQRVFSRLINGVQTHYVQLRSSGTVTLTTAATRLINKGSIWATWDFIGIDENGRDRVLLDGRVLRYMSEFFSPSALSASRLTATGTGATALVESARIYFAHPLAAAPAETVFKERDPRQTLQVFAQLRADGGIGGLMAPVSGNSMSVVPSIAIEHGYDDITGELPVFVPSIRQQVVSVASANTQLTEFIKTSNFIRAIILQQDTDAGEVGDIITGLALRADGDDIIGPGQVAWDDLCRGMEFEFGGAVYTTGVTYGQSAYLGINFQQNGRLSNVVSPALLNLRFEFNVAVSAQTGGTTGNKIRITILELERVAGLVTDKIPFPA
jgi:hypothetical protein